MDRNDLKRAQELFFLLRHRIILRRKIEKGLRSSSEGWWSRGSAWQGPPMFSLPQQRGWGRALGATLGLGALTLHVHRGERLERGGCRHRLVPAAPTGTGSGAAPAPCSRGHRRQRDEPEGLVLAHQLPSVLGRVRRGGASVSCISWLLAVRRVAKHPPAGGTAAVSR